MQSGGGVTEACVCVCVWMGGDIMGCLPPDLFVCVSARARGVCSGARGEKGDGDVRTRCRKNTEIYLN